MPRLFVISGDDLGRTYDFDRAVVLGRGDTADLRLRSVSVSRHHARVEPDPATGGWRVVDLDSRNGLAVGGRRVPAAPLTEGGVFALGDVELRFRAEGGPAMGAPIVLGTGTAAPGRGATRAAEPVERALDETAPRRAPVPPPPASPPPPPPAADEETELELEGDWQDVVPPPPTGGVSRFGTLGTGARSPGAQGPGTLGPLAGASAEPRRPPAQAGAPSAAERERDARRAALLRGQGAGAAAPPKAAAAGTRPVLQYHRVEGSGGVLGADLAQRPWWARAALWLLGLGLLAGLAYGALELTRKLRASEATLTAPDGDGSATD